MSGTNFNWRKVLPQKIEIRFIIGGRLDPEINLLGELRRELPRIEFTRQETVFRMEGIFNEPIDIWITGPVGKEELLQLVHFLYCPRLHFYQEGWQGIFPLTLEHDNVLLKIGSTHPCPG